MSTFFRFTGMGLFVTAGAAVAICIATSPFDGPFNSRRKDVAQSAAFLHPLNAFPRVLADVTSLASNDSAASSPANSLPNVSSAATVSTTATTAANHSFENVGAPYQTSSSPDAAIAYPATDGNPTVANRAASETSAAAPPDVRLAQAPGALPSLDQLPGLLDSITKQADQNSSAAA